MSDSGQTVERAAERETQNQKMLLCEVMSSSGQNLEDSSGHSNREQTDVTV